MKDSSSSYFLAPRKRVNKYDEIGFGDVVGRTLSQVSNMYLLS